MLQHMFKHRIDPLSIYSKANRKRFLIAGLLSVVAILLLDAATPGFPVGFLYLFPILLMAGFVSRKTLIFLALICGGLTGEYSDYRLGEAISVSIMAWIAFTGAGFLVAEILKSRQLLLEHEKELRGLVESSPLAIITLDSSGRILLANEAAQVLLAAEQNASISGLQIADILPALQTVVEQHRSKVFRTELRCRGKRRNGEVFLAAVWFSTSPVAFGKPIITAFIVDLSEDLRDREDQGLQHLLVNTKIVVGAIAHEVRNLCGAVRITYGNLSRCTALQGNEDFSALGTLIAGLERIAAVELQPGEHKEASYVELTSVLDELRIVIEPTCIEGGMEVVWELQDVRGLVRGDRSGLLQVFLNIVRNSQRAVIASAEKRLTIRATTTRDNSVIIAFEDTGCGVSHPENLFRPFQANAASTGLGLYLSRAILRSFGADIMYAPCPKGSRFSVVLQSVKLPELSHV